MHPDDPAAQQPAGAVGVAPDRQRSTRGRHTSRRLQFGRLVLLVAISLIASAGVALVLPWVFPPEPLATMADPSFDAKAFYQAHPSAGINRGIAYAFTPGLPSQPKPVAGLSQAETNNAFIVIEVGRQMGLPKRAYVVAIATALQESHLHNLANSGVSASLKFQHEGVESNFDSLGIFQQRPSQGWGSVAQLMDPAQAAARFYARLLRVNNWPSLSVTGAAQAVQRSAFPGAYAKHVDLAQNVVDTMPSYS